MMTDRVTAARDMLQRQLQELDAIEKEVLAESLNTVRGTERVRQWKARTVPLLAAHLGRKDADRFGATTPGPSFTNDLFEEFSDEVALYRSVLVALVQSVQQQSPG